jgi:hypothetical protein
MKCTSPVGLDHDPEDSNLSAIECYYVAEMIKAFCRCTGESCKHHQHLEPCPNEPLPPLEPIIDPTGTPIAGSFTGLCEECREPYFLLADDGAQ